MAAVCISGCASTSRSGGPHASDTSDPGIAQYQWGDAGGLTASAGDDYERLIDQATRRDGESLRTLFWLTSPGRFDGAAAQEHATVLGRLLRDLGDITFGTALRGEPPARRDEVHGALRYDFGVGEGGVRNELLVEWFPLTFGRPPGE